MVTRKEFLRKSLSIATGFAASVVQKAAGLPPALNAGFLYPPGAAGNFHEVCSSCGDCASACPEGAIKMTPHKLSDKKLPVLFPAQNACAMCADIPCIAACESGALTLPDGNVFPAIGVAEIAEQNCLAWNGSVCMTCYDACPLKRTALKFRMNRPVVDSGACTGCGGCEYVCPVEDKGIVVKPL